MTTKEKSGMDLAIEDIRAEMHRAKDRGNYSARDWSMALLFVGAGSMVAFREHDGLDTSTSEGQQAAINEVLSIVMNGVLSYMNDKHGLQMTLGRVVPITPEKAEMLRKTLELPDDEDTVH